MQTYASVAVDTENNHRVAGWETPTVDLSTEPQSGPRIANAVRDRVRRSIEALPNFPTEGLRRLEQTSREHAEYNRSVLSRSPMPDDARRTRDMAREEDYRTEVQRLDEAARRREASAVARVEREEERKRKEEERKRKEEERRRRRRNANAGRRIPVNSFEQRPTVASTRFSKWTFGTSGSTGTARES